MPTPKKDVVKEDALRMAQEMLAAVPFQSIYSNADTLFDKESQPFNSPELTEQIEFFKNTPLNKMVFENITGNPNFTIKNETTGKSIEVSNRTSSKGEFRGELLRQYLEQQKQRDPKKTLFSALSERINDPQYSSMVTMVKSLLTSESFYQDQANAVAMSPTHCDLYIKNFFEALNKKIAEEHIQYDPKVLQDVPQKQADLLQGIDLGGIYDSTFKHSKTPQFQNAIAKLTTLSENDKITTPVRRQLQALIIKSNELLDKHFDTEKNPEVFLSALTKALELTAEGISNPTNKKTLPALLDQAVKIDRQYGKQTGLGGLLRALPAIAYIDQKAHPYETKKEPQTNIKQKVAEHKAQNLKATAEPEDKKDYRSYLGTRK